MALKTCTFLLAALLLQAECRHHPRPSLSEEGPNFLDLLLQSRGTSVDRIHQKVADADGDLDLVISRINAEVKGDLVGLDGDAVHLNPQELRSLLKEAFSHSFKDQLGDNPAALSFLEQSIDDKLNSQAEQFDRLVNENRINQDSLKEFLQTHHINRNRRSLQSKDFDLNQMISNMLLDLIRSQFSGIIWNVLESVKNFAIQFRVNTSADDKFINAVDYVVNTIVDGIVEGITRIQEAILPSNNDTVSRRRRAAEDGTEVTTSGSGDVDGGSGGGGGGLNFLLCPLLNVLALLLTPIRLLLELVTGLLSTLLGPLVGDFVIGSLTSALNSVVDLLMPQFPVACF